MRHGKDGRITERHRLGPLQAIWSNLLLRVEKEYMRGEKFPCVFTDTRLNHTYKPRQTYPWFSMADVPLWKQWSYVGGMDTLFSAFFAAEHSFWLSKQIQQSVCGSLNTHTQQRHEPTFQINWLVLSQVSNTCERYPSNSQQPEVLADSAHWCNCSPADIKTLQLIKDRIQNRRSC